MNLDLLRFDYYVDHLADLRSDLERERLLKEARHRRVLRLSRAAVVAAMLALMFLPL